jgi:Uma2 family endonuclease
MSPIGLKHAATVKRLNNLLAIQLQDLAIISVQDPIQLDNYSEPQPDIVLLKPRADFYETQIPQPADVYLIIEVSDSSLNYDQTVKLPLYAENKIPEVWLVNLPEQILEVYRQPQGKCYQKQQKNVQSISPLAFSDILVISQDILG